MIKLALFQQLLQQNLVPNVLGFLSFGAYQQRREGDPDAWATQILYIICPGLHPVEDRGVEDTPLDKSMYIKPV